MKKHPSTHLHRMILWGALVFGATLLLLNAWMISSSESDLLLTPWLAK